MTYTHGHHESVLRSHRWRTVENSAAYVASQFVSGASVLDVGCGPGTITIDIARRVAPGRVVGIDASADVIEQARRNGAGVDNVEFTTGDVYALDFADASFDVVHAHQVLQHLPDPVGALREMRRVCKPDGVVAARDSDYAAFTWYPGDPVLEAWLALYRQIARANRGEPDAGRHLLQWAHAAGFSDVAPGASAWCFATPEQRDLVGRSLGRPHDDLGHRRPGRARRIRDPRRARGDGRGVANVGRPPRRLVRRPPRRDHLPPVARDDAVHGTVSTPRGHGMPHGRFIVCTSLLAISTTKTRNSAWTLHRLHVTYRGHRQSAVDHEGLAGDELGVVAREEHARRRRGPRARASTSSRSARSCPR